MSERTVDTIIVVVSIMIIAIVVAGLTYAVWWIWEYTNADP